MTLYSRLSLVLLSSLSSLHARLQEHIRQSRESKLDELGRHSTKLTKSRENIAMAQLTKIPPPFDPESPTSINLIESNATNHHYYRDTMPNNNGARIIDSKNDLNLREQEIKNILGSSYDDDRKDGEMCDMACQTRYVINQFFPLLGYCFIPSRHFRGHLAFAVAMIVMIDG